MSVPIKTSQTIVVNKNVESVFDFFANPSNDRLWRTEINQTTLNGPLQPGVIASEYSYLSKKAPNNLIELTCVAFEKNTLATFETPANARFYLKSQRQVKALSANTTEVTYRLEFDTAIATFAVGFALPKFIIALKANADRKKYLRQLKIILEKT